MSNEDHASGAGPHVSATGAESSVPGVDELRLFKTLADNAFFGNVISDSDGIIRYANRYFAEIHGYTPEEMIGQHFSLVHTPEQVAISRQIMAKAHQNGNSEPREHWFLHRDGTTFPLLVGAVAVPTEDGASTNMAMSAVDVSAVHRAEAAYQTLFNEMLDGFAHHQIICDEAGAPVDYRYIAANPAFEGMTGLRATDIVGRTVREVLPGVEQAWIDNFGRVALTGVPARFEDHVAVLDKYFEVTAFSPAPGEFACIFQDITESKRASEALRLRETELTRTQRMARLGSWTWNASTDETEWTDALREIFDLDPASPVPTLAEQAAIFTPASYATLVEAVTRTVESGVPYELELEIARADGESRWLWGRGERAVDRDGRVTGLWGAAQDITDRKANEAERSHLEAQLARAQRLESVGRLAGSVAHDFNNMLTVILGHTERSLARTRPEDPIHADLEEIRQAADRSADLTRQLLAFARNQPAKPAVIDLNQTVTGVLTMLTRLIGEDTDFVWRPGEGLSLVRIDPSQVGQILANLCVNARDAITNPGRIVVETGHATFDEDFCSLHPDYLSGDFVHLGVTDNGSGMDAETLSHVFEPFFTTKEAERGTGLGLSTTYGIVRQNHGFVCASSQPGVGTTFSVYLPRVDATLEPSPEPSPHAPASEATGRDGATILLVEDEPAILTLAKRSLEGQGYLILPATTPTEAIRLAAEHPGEIDLLLTDVIMPEMNGRELADALTPTHPSMKVLFMSGYTSDVITGHGTPEGDSNFISKPFHLRDLTQKVREVLDA